MLSSHVGCESETAFLICYVLDDLFALRILPERTAEQDQEVSMNA